LEFLSYDNNKESLYTDIYNVLDILLIPTPIKSSKKDAKIVFQCSDVRTNNIIMYNTIFLQAAKMYIYMKYTHKLNYRLITYKSDKVIL